jgi:NAD(P)-dependent dehydrogenase (short-subunit alcohol dehydrogenase family)
MGKLDGKVALITGGASGIGEASVRLMHAEGASVVAADIQDDLGKALIETLGERTAYQHCDVSQNVDIEAAIAFTKESFGRLDILFNNAGFGGPGGPIEDTPMDEYDHAMIKDRRTAVLVSPDRILGNDPTG